MKKLIILFLFLPLFAAAQTLPNGNFESWFFVGSSENPEFWITNNTEIETAVTKDFDSYEGEIAMRVTAEPTDLGEYGEANTLFEINAIPAALNFYAKTQIEFSGASVEITFLNQDVEVYTEQWYSPSSLMDYTLISIPLNQIVPGIITHARIKVAAQAGDLVGGSAWISVDAMEFGEPLSVKKMELNTFTIYPNPTSNLMSIQTDANLESVDIFNITGVKIKSLNASELNKTIDVSALSKGIYLIKFNTATESFVKRIVIE